MLSERQRTDLRAKVDQAGVDVRDVDYRAVKFGFVAFCPSCRREGLFRSGKTGATKVEALAHLETHLRERHGQRLVIPNRPAVDAAPWVTETTFA